VLRVPAKKPRWELKELVGTYTLGPLRLGDGSTTLRIELYKAVRPKGSYEARVWREDFFRVQPTFPQQGGMPKHAPADKLLLVEENLFIGLQGSSVKKALAVVVKKVTERLDASDGERL
jgi:hypothetical protein